MTYELISNRNMTQGFHIIFIYVNDITGGLFIRMFLFSIWIIFAMGSYFLQKRHTGMGDFPMSIAIAGFVTSIIAILLKLIPGMLDLLTLAVVLIVSVISVLWFLFSHK